MTTVDSQQFITTQMHTAASLHALGHPILGGRKIAAEEIPRLQADGEPARAGSVVFLVDAGGDDFEQAVGCVRRGSAEGSFAAYHRGICICKESLRLHRNHDHSASPDGAEPAAEGAHTVAEEIQTR